MPDCPDAEVEAVKVPALALARDQAACHPTRAELPRGHDAPLRGCACCHPPLRANRIWLPGVGSEMRFAGHGRTVAPPACASGARFVPSYARETYSPLRVSTRTRSPSLTKSGTWTTTPDSSVAGLVPPPEAVSPFRPGSV